MIHRAPPELHLPDLPEIAVQLGLPDDGGVPGAPTRVASPWGYRLRQGLASYMPLLLMGLLAASTWWLVKNTPQGEGPLADKPPRESPDYTMAGFSITRFSPEGLVVLRIAGDSLRHFPATDRLEIEGVRIHAIAPDGRTTDATARRALANGDGSEVQLLGGARVVSQLEGAEVLELQGEFLHAFLRFERIRSHLPVQLRHGGTETRAGGLDYDHLQQQLQLSGPVRATLQPGVRAKPPARAASAAQAKPVKAASYSPAAIAAAPVNTVPTQTPEPRR
jgi:lipopolysaccharide export system protein LptC